MSDFNDKATVSGSVVSIENGADEVGAKSCVVTIPASLSGVSSVTETQTGANLFPFPIADYWETGDINATTGEDEPNEYNTRTKDYLPVSATTIYISGVTNSGSSDKFRFFFYASDKSFISRTNYSNTASVTVPYNAVWFKMRYQTASGSFSNPSIFGQADQSYQPYIKTQYTANLGRTIYGGEVDIVNGEGTDENGNDFTFDGQEIDTMLGYNAFWSDEGDTELTYYKSGYGFTSVTVNRTGKNIYNKEDGVYDDTYFNQDGTTTHYADVAVSWIRVNPNTKYTFSLGATPSRSTFLRWINCDKDKNFISRPVASYGSQNFPYTVTTPNDCQWVQLAINEYPAAQISSNDWIIQIEESNSATTYEAFSGISKTAKLHKVIYAGEVDVIKGTAKPKNLFDADNPNVISGYISTTAFSTGNQNAKTVYVPIKAGTTYTVSKTAGQRFQIATSNVIPSDGALYTSRVSQSGSQSSLTITSGANDTYLWAWVFLDGTDTGTLAEMLSSVQIEEGSYASDYVPGFTPFTFPPISMETDEGENTLFANEGDSAIIYRKQAE